MFSSSRSRGSPRSGRSHVAPSSGFSMATECDRSFSATLAVRREALERPDSAFRHFERLSPQRLSRCRKSFRFPTRTWSCKGRKATDISLVNPSDHPTLNLLISKYLGNAARVRKGRQPPNQARIGDARSPCPAIAFHALGRNRVNSHDPPPPPRFAASCELKESKL